MASFEVSDSTIMQVLRMRAGQDERIKDLLESMSWEAVAMEQAARLQVLEQSMTEPADPFPQQDVEVIDLTEGEPDITDD